MNESNLPNHKVDNWFQLNRLADIIKHKSRYVIKEPYKSFVDSIMDYIQKKFSSAIPTSSILYRARVNEINLENRDDETIPLNPEQMGSPPHYTAKSGRINPEGIPYLYCSDEIDTAGSELRPRKGAFLTIGEVKLKRDITIADLTLDCNDKEWDLFFYDFADLFSIQWPTSLKYNYLVTQYFAEHLKSIGFRGVKYKSDFNNGGANYALFYKEDYDITTTYVVVTSEVSYLFYKK